MTKTEQEIISLVVQRYEAMESKYKLRKEIAVIKRWVTAKVAAEDFEGVDDNWYTEASYLDGGDRTKKIHVYTTDELEDLYRDYHGCSHEITNILGRIRYHCKKHIKETSLITEKNKLEKELAQ